MEYAEVELPDIHRVLHLIDQLDVGIVVIDRDLVVRRWNGFMEQFSGIRAFDAMGHSIFKSLRDIPEQWLSNHCQQIFENHHRVFSNWEIRPYITKLQPSRPVSGPDQWMTQNVSLIPLNDVLNEISQIAILIYDVTEVSLNQRLLQKQIEETETANEKLAGQYAKSQALLKELKQTQSQLMQSEKLASIGQLAAGVAHEINNPIGFVNSNFARLSEYTADLGTLIATYEEIIGEREADDPAIQSLQELKKKMDFEFMLEDIDDLVNESRDGIERVKNIVQGLKDFSRVGDESWNRANLNECIESTLTICWNEIKYNATVDKHYGDIPEIDCIPAQLNQVFMNLLVNAGQAIEEKGVIGIETSADEQYVNVLISDTGKGIAEEQLSKIFDPFFTTKPIGKGTGLGLAITYGIIEKHNGEITVNSRVNEGTTFRVRLPIKRAAEVDGASAPPHSSSSH